MLSEIRLQYIEHDDLENETSVTFIKIYKIKLNEKKSVYIEVI
jgi:hypothetical protein